MTARTALYDGTCIKCHQPISKGDRILWAKGQGARHPDGVCQAQELPEPTGDLKKCVDYLYAQSRAGKLNDFTASLLAQYEKRGRLSEKQIAAVIRKIPGATPVPNLPSGRYAVQDSTGAWLLINVWHPRGNPEVQRLYHVQSYDDKGHALRGAEEISAAVLIAKDPARAAIEFGHRTGHCYRCGHELDVNLSRSMGVGPTCVKHVMEDEPRLAMTRLHRDAIRAAGLDPAEKNDDLSNVTVAR